MPRLINQNPRYRKHRASGQAVVRLDGRDHYLGPYGSKVSRDEFDRLISEWLDLTTAFVENGNMLVRVFNCEGDANTGRIALDRRVQRVRMVELDDRLIEELASIAMSAAWAL